MVSDFFLIEHCLFDSVCRDAHCMNQNAENKTTQQMYCYLHRLLISGSRGLVFDTSMAV